MSVSSCCSAELKVSYGSEGTGCYLCAKCGKPCDAKEEKISKRSESIVYDRDRLEAENVQLKAALKKAGEAFKELDEIFSGEADIDNNGNANSAMRLGIISYAVLNDPTMKRVMEEKS